MDTLEYVAPVSNQTRNRIIQRFSLYYQFMWASLVAQEIKKIHLQCSRPGFDPWIGKIPWRRERLPHSRILAWRILEIYSPRGHKESNITEQLSLTRSCNYYIHHFFKLINDKQKTQIVLCVPISNNER